MPRALKNQAVVQPVFTRGSRLADGLAETAATEGATLMRTPIHEGKQLAIMCVHDHNRNWPQVTRTNFPQKRAFDPETSGHHDADPEWRGPAVCHTTATRCRGKSYAS